MRPHGVNGVPPVCGAVVEIKGAKQVEKFIAEPIRPILQNSRKIKSLAGKVEIPGGVAELVAFPLGQL